MSADATELVCDAEGCAEQAPRTTLIGLRFCAPHFLAWYSTKRVPLKWPNHGPDLKHEAG